MFLRTNRTKLNIAKPHWPSLPPLSLSLSPLSYLKYIHSINGIRNIFYNYRKVDYQYQYKSIYLYIYIYIERESVWERERERERGGDVCMGMCVWVSVWGKFSLIAILQWHLTHELKKNSNNQTFDDNQIKLPEHIETLFWKVIFFSYRNLSFNKNIGKYNLSLKCSQQKNNFM